MDLVVMNTVMNTPGNTLHEMVTHSHANTQP
jgi:hypothetical protein